MSKRGADNYMTDQNWEEEEELEEAGVFKQAEREILQSRQVKKAKRRGPVSGESTESGTGGIFKGFTGFSKISDSASFAGLGSKPLATNGSGTSSNGEAFKSTLFSASVATSKTSETKDSKPSGPATDTDEGSRSPSGARTKYLHQLKSLNEGVTKWIKEHVDKNPYCILTPIFKDYEKYLSDIEKKYPRTEEKLDKKEEPAQKSQPPTETTPVASFTPLLGNTTSGGFSVPSKETGSEKSATTTATSPPVFSFGAAQSAEKSCPVTITGTSITSPPTTLPTFSGFKFGNTTSLFGKTSTGTSEFSFASVQKKDQDSAATDGGNPSEEDYVPPKTDVKAVEEDDALYTKRCKLFFKKDEQWKEKGVGNLHLKPCGEKTQLLVRADTNLGNILLNIMLTASLPVSRQGKNNVALVCVPNPPLDEKNPDNKTMVPMLIRVKTSEDADELLEKLKDNKR